jgi:2-C-methyl-D-erythritol 4-phosphate cytidylyltransferase
LGKVAAIIPAAGQGKRMGGTVNKQLLKLRDKPVLAHTLEIFQQCPLIGEIVIVASQDELATIENEIVIPFNINKTSHIVLGGKERQDSIRNGLAVLDAETEWVVVHDGARPLLLPEELLRIIGKAFELESVIAAVPAKDTIKQVDETGKVIATPARESLWCVQTPQIFKKDLLKLAHLSAHEAGLKGTDDASLVEALGHQVTAIMGSYENIKITTPEDLNFALTILQRRERS